MYEKNVDLDPVWIGCTCMFTYPGVVLESDSHPIHNCYHGLFTFTKSGNKFSYTYSILSITLISLKNQSLMFVNTCTCSSKKEIPYSVKYFLQSAVYYAYITTVINLTHLSNPCKTALPIKYIIIYVKSKRIVRMFLQ